jgi:hypothetical protein
VPYKIDGIVDLEGKKEVNSRIQAVQDALDKRETELLQKTSYKPQFSSYIYEEKFDFQYL